MSVKKIEVFFAKGPVLPSDVPPQTIIVAPSMDQWNDFGHRTLASIYVRIDASSAVEEFDAYLGFFYHEGKRTDGATAVHSFEHRAENGFFVVPDDVQPFTMLRNMDMYRSFVSAFGVDAAETLLASLSDVVALGGRGADADIFAIITLSDVFAKSFLRSSDAYFTYKNAGAILMGAKYERFDGISTDFALRFRLEGRAEDCALDFKFAHDGDLPKRMAILIGKNGVGKSQALGRIARSLLENDRALLDGRDGGRVKVNRLMAFSPTNESTVAFPSSRRRYPLIPYKLFSLNRRRRLRTSENTADLLVQIARSEEYIGENRRWKIFLRLLNVVQSSHQISLVCRLPGSGFVRLEELDRGGEQSRLERFSSIDPQLEPVRVINGKQFHLSSGEISFLRFAAQSSLFIENGSLLLFDEPETHLHPNYINRFMASLNELLAATGSLAIIATHSAYIVREVFRDQVIILRSGSEGAFEAVAPTLRTFGADVGSISYFVFGEDEPSSLADEVVARLMAAHSSWGQIYEKYKDELSQDILSDLRRRMEPKELS